MEASNGSVAAMERLSLGTKYPLLCVGATATGEGTSKPRPLDYLNQDCVATGKTADLKTAGDRGVKEIIDQGYERAELIPGDTAANEVLNIVEDEESTNNNAVFPLVVIAGLGIILMNSFG